MALLKYYSVYSCLLSQICFCPGKRTVTAFTHGNQFLILFYSKADESAQAFRLWIQCLLGMANAKKFYWQIKVRLCHSQRRCNSTPLFSFDKPLGSQLHNSANATMPSSSCTHGQSKISGTRKIWLDLVISELPCGICFLLTSFLGNEWLIITSAIKRNLYFTKTQRRAGSSFNFWSLIGPRKWILLLFHSASGSFGKAGESLCGHRQALSSGETLQMSTGSPRPTTFWVTTFCTYYVYELKPCVVFMMSGSTLQCLVRCDATPANKFIALLISLENICPNFLGHFL